MKANVSVAKPVSPVPIERLGQTFGRFTRISGSSGILLLFATLVALVWANSPLSDLYEGILQQHFAIGFNGVLIVDEALLVWINDALMAIFFFVVGLEIKREVLIGELSSVRQATLPIVAAVGGMAVPAAIYALFNSGGAGAVGWGIPMATDIAFALGILSLLGKRVPLSLKIFLTALAIVDDLGAVLVIAIFYTDAIVWSNLLLGIAFLAGLAAYSRAGGRSLLVYSSFAVAVWAAFFFSGVHATVAGVLVAMTIPVRRRIDSKSFLEYSHKLIHIFESQGTPGPDVYINAQQRAAVRELEQACELVETPLHRLEDLLHPWVAYAIMPLFALANAGVQIGADSLSAVAHPISLGIILGLVVGKLLGISLSTFVAVRLKLAALPRGVRWPHIIGASALAGMGFTMSLFIAGLAFGEGHGVEIHAMAKTASPALFAANDELHDIAKIGILVASLIAGVLGTLLLRQAGERDQVPAETQAHHDQEGEP